MNVLSLIRLILVVFNSFPEMYRYNRAAPKKILKTQ